MPEIPPLSGPRGLNRSAAQDSAGSGTPCSSDAATLSDLVAQAFAPDGPLARSLREFEPRSGQVEMAAQIARCFEQGGVLLAEAGTGTGKTLAYLIPAVLSRQRVLISTGTKNLQEQLFFKDIPALREAIGVPFTATYMKGRTNYLCLHRLDQFEGDGLTESYDLLPVIREWSQVTTTGDRAELGDLPEELALWNDLSATAETCLGSECPRYDDCFVTRMRQQAAASDIVIVNHHLLCADAALRHSGYTQVIPSCSHVVVDEAHQLEEVATHYFGYAVSTYRLSELARDYERLAATTAQRQTPRESEATFRAIDRLRDASRAFFTDLAAAHAGGHLRPRGDGRVRVSERSLASVESSGPELLRALDSMGSVLESPRARDAGWGEDDAAGEEADGDASALARRAREISNELRLLLRTDDPDYVRFVEFRGKGIFLRASPIEVSAIVREFLLDKMRATVMTSATLTVDGSFEYVRTRLGIERADELRLPSEFDFTRQAIVYLPPHMPDPRSSDFLAAAGREIVELVRRTQGRAFVLFTSYAALAVVHEIVGMALEYPVLVQGMAPRSQLLRQFRETPHAVLLATSSFWQGVDVVGEALSCVIVDKLPFASPSDPVVAARIEALRVRGGQPFEDYQVPLAILTLQQGLGRLIRHRRDRGVLAVLDPRLRTRNYGWRFMAALPPAPIVYDLETVEGFLSIV